jgi:precorrin-6B methylase 2
MAGERGAIDAEGSVQPESGLDWNELWKRDFAHDGVNDMDNEKYWDKRSQTFGCHGPQHHDGRTDAGPNAKATPSPVDETNAPAPSISDDDARATAEPSAYAADFLRLAGLLPGETVIDMGCGTGSLALPVAAQGHHVTACDLSGGMLSRLRARAQAAGVADAIDIRKMSWLDDWDDLPVADVMFASRSLYSTDMRATLLKMERHARRRCCATVATVDSPLHDRTMLEAIGRSQPKTSEHVYLFNLLAQMGRLPEIAYISHVKPTFGNTFDEVVAEFTRDAGPLSDEEHARLERYVAEHFDFENRTPQGMPRRNYTQIVRWAFVGWDVPQE